MTLREEQMDDPVSSVMTKGLLTIDIRKNLQEAVKILADFDIGSLLVVKGSEPVGIFTTKDIVRALAKDLDFKKVKIKEVMQAPIITISAYESVSSALLKMKEMKINHLIVTDGDKVIGMLNPLNLLAF